MKRSRIAVLALSLTLVAVLTGAASCGSAYHDTVVAEHDFSLVVKNFQDAEIAAAHAGQIPPATHKLIESKIEKVGLASEALVKALQSGAAKPTVLGALQAVVDAVSDLQANGVLPLTNQTAKDTLTAAIGAINALLQNIGTMINAQGGK